MKKVLFRLVIVVLVVMFVLSIAATAFAYDPWPNPKWSQSTFGLVKRGSNSAQAILVQWNCYAAQAKRTNGKIMARNEVDGIIGPNSQQYIKSYQLKKGLKADGIVGNATWGKMQTYVSSNSDPSTGVVVYSTHDAIKVPKTSEHTKAGHWFTWNRNDVKEDII